MSSIEAITQKTDEDYIKNLYVEAQDLKSNTAEINTITSTFINNNKRITTGDLKFNNPLINPDEMLFTDINKNVVSKSQNTFNPYCQQILSTEIPRSSGGYVINKPSSVVETFKIAHTQLINKGFDTVLDVNNDIVEFKPQQSGYFKWEWNFIANSVNTANIFISLYDGSTSYTALEVETTSTVSDYTISTVFYKNAGDSIYLAPTVETPPVPFDMTIYTSIQNVIYLGQ